MVQNIINITPLSLISNSSEFIGSLSKILLCDKIIIQIYTVLYDILFKSFQFYVNKKASVRRLFKPEAFHLVLLWL